MDKRLEDLYKEYDIEELNDFPDTTGWIVIGRIKLDKAPTVTSFMTISSIPALKFKSTRWLCDFNAVGFIRKGYYNVLVNDDCSYFYRMNPDEVLEAISKIIKFNICEKEKDLNVIDGDEAKVNTISTSNTSNFTYQSSFTSPISSIIRITSISALNNTYAGQLVHVTDSNSLYMVGNDGNLTKIY